MMMTDDISNRKDGIHIGLIPDGSRRWATDRGLAAWEGHYAGAMKMRRFLHWCIETEIIGVRDVTVYALSTDNLSRPGREIGELWNILRNELDSLRKDPIVSENGIQVRVIGDEALWHPGFKEAAREVINATKGGAAHILNVAAAYSGTWELGRIVRKAREALRIEKLLEVKSIDLLIRTGDQHRLSNFFPYQSAYTELRFSKVMWPAYTKREFDTTLRWYVRQQRRFGK